MHTMRDAFSLYTRSCAAVQAASRRSGPSFAAWGRRRGGRGRSRCRCRRASHYEANTIYDESGKGQNKKELWRWQSNMEQGVEGIGAGTGKADGNGGREQLQRELNAALAVPEPVFPVAFGNRHKHRAEDTGSAQRR